MNASNWYTLAVVFFVIAIAAAAAAVFLFFKLKIPAVIGDLTGKTVAREIEAMRKNNEAGVKIHRASQTPASENQENDADTASQTTNKATVLSAQAIAHPSMRLDNVPKPGEATVQDSGQERVGFGQSSRRTMKLPEERPPVDKKTTEELLENAHGHTEKLPDEAGQTGILDANRWKETVPLDYAAQDTAQTDVLPETLIQTNILSENEWQTNILPDESHDDKAGYTAGRPLGTTFLGGDEDEEQAIAPVPFRIVRSFVEVHSDEIIV